MAGRPAAWSAFDEVHKHFFAALAGGRREVVQPFDLLGAQLDAVGGCVLRRTRFGGNGLDLEHGPERIYRPSVSSRPFNSAGSAAMAFNYPRSDSSGERDPEAIRVESRRAELVGLFERRTGSDGRHETAIPELKLYRYSHPTEPTYVLQEPAVYVVVQGRKQVMLGDETYVYDRSQYLAVSVELPVVGNVFEVSPEEEAAAAAEGA